MASSREFIDYTLGWDSPRNAQRRAPSINRRQLQTSTPRHVTAPDHAVTDESDMAAAATGKLENPTASSVRDQTITSPIEPPALIPSPTHTLSAHNHDDYITEDEYTTSREGNGDDDTVSFGGHAPEPVLHAEQLRNGDHSSILPNGVSMQHLVINKPAYLHDAPRRPPLTPSIRSFSEMSQQPVDSITGAVPPPIKQGRGFTQSPSNASERSRPARRDGNLATSRMPEFFSQAVFQTVLHNPTIAHHLLKFAQSRLCGENMEFLARIARYNALLEEVSKSIYEIHEDFIAHDAPTQVNLPEHVLYRANTEMKSALSSTLPALGTIFNEAQGDIERLVYTDIYPNFVRHQMGVSAAKALGTDKSRYAGLGDCFVLTDPAKADNPILYASDGFVKVTGYQRNEIIPRNCRFLQCRYTDRATVRRIKVALDQRVESVELLLNQKKSGEPFWNLLFCAPLYDANGMLHFFLGAQINCSTTVHSASDVLRILSQSKEADEAGQPTVQLQVPTRPKPCTSFFSAFRSGTRASVEPQEVGMEQKLVGKIGGMPLKGQIDSFYNAYSNVSPTYSHLHNTTCLTLAVHRDQCLQLPRHLHLNPYTRPSIPLESETWTTCCRNRKRHLQIPREPQPEFNRQ